MYDFHIVELKTFCDHTKNTANEQPNDVSTDNKGDRAGGSHSQGDRAEASHSQGGMSKT